MSEFSFSSSAGSLQVALLTERSVTDREGSVSVSQATTAEKLEASLTALSAQAALDCLTKLRAAAKRLIFAESLTAGLCAAQLALHPHASECLEGALVCYTDAAKRAFLDVDSTLLQNYGSVSKQAAEAMALGALAKASSANVAAALTGFAGPPDTNWEQQAACGTVFLSLAFAYVASDFVSAAPAENSATERAGIAAFKQVFEQFTREALPPHLIDISFIDGENVETIALLTYKQLFPPVRNLVRSAAALWAYDELNFWLTQLAKEAEKNNE